MKNLLHALCSVLVLATVSFSQFACASEVTVFNSAGHEAAYIDADNGGILYLWEGQPVAYLSGDSIYGYNGRHLGWFEDGIVRDNDGYVVGFLDGVTGITTFVGRIKGIKDAMPVKSQKEPPPIRPRGSPTWSEIPIEKFLMQGR